MERGKQYYNQAYEKWYPWLEDQYLYYFGKDNKASYATKDQLSKTKVTGIGPVDNLQDGVNETVAGQVGKGGLLQPVGDFSSKQGVNRVERGGKDEQGSYGGPAAGWTDGAVDGAKGAGAKVGGLFGGGGEEEKKK